MRRSSASYRRPRSRIRCRSRLLSLPIAVKASMFWHTSQINNCARFQPQNPLGNRPSPNASHFMGLEVAAELLGCGVRQESEEELNRSESGTVVQDASGFTEDWKKNPGASPRTPAPAYGAVRQTGLHLPRVFHRVRVKPRASWTTGMQTRGRVARSLQPSHPGFRLFAQQLRRRAMCIEEAASRPWRPWYDPSRHESRSDSRRASRQLP